MRILRRVLVVLSCFVVPAATAAGQRFVDVAAGWTRPGGATSAGETFSDGFNARVSFGSVVAPRLRLSADFTGVGFNRRDPFFQPCPQTGCPTPSFISELSGLAGVNGAAHVDIDARGHFYLLGGGGGYAEFLEETRFRTGVLAGAGLSLPTHSRTRAIVEARWQRLFGDALGPASFVSVSTGLRF